MKNQLRISCMLFLFACVLMGACKQQPATSPYVEIENEAVRRGDEALRKYKSADYQTAKSALVDLLKFLDKASYPPDAPDEFRVDAMSTCVRLAKLEEKQGHTAELASYMNQAVTRCQTLKIRKCDENSLRKEVDRLDTLIK